MPPEDQSAADYAEFRPLMFSIAYRMTGSISDAEDIVQEAFLRLTRVLRDGASIESPKAYLATATTRMAISHLRSARVRRESYVGAWLPEVFGYDYKEIADITGKSEPNCRQILARARHHVDDGKPRFEASRQQREEVARRFFAAAAGG